MMTYHISTSKKFLCNVIDFTIFHLSHVFFFLLKILCLFHFKKKNKVKKGNTLMDYKYLLFRSRIDLFDIKDF